MTFEAKLPHYNAQNMLARALGAAAYVNNPSFLALNDELGHLFKPCVTFHRAHLDTRQKALQCLAKAIWSPMRMAAPLDQR